MNLVSLPLTKIRTDGGTQSRAVLDDDYAAELALDVDALPPATVYYDGRDYWLADGFHRHESHGLAKRKHMIVDLRQGTRREAQLCSAGANGCHGLRRTNADKRLAVEMLLGDPEWSQWSNREIARRCAVDEGVVRNLRPGKAADNPQPALVRDPASLTPAELAALPEEEQERVYQAIDREIEAEMAPTHSAADDGLRAVSVRLPLVVVQLLDSIAAKLETDRAGAIERVLRRFGKRVA